MRGRHYVGTSGWVYKHWDDVFYPPDLPNGTHLAFYAQRFDTVEVNYSFYRLPTRAVFARWREAVAPHFTFSVKASRYLTHRKRLKDPAEPVQRLLEAASALEEKLGPLLFQFPAQWAKDLGRLAEFLAILPVEHRYAFEFRHPSWLSAEIYAALERHRCALCIPDHPAMPQDVRLTTDFTYVRFHSGQHGPEYRQDELAAWAKRLRDLLSRGIDAYAYFNNDVGGYALRNAAAMRSMLEEREAAAS